jgi:hypothetical protein
MPGGARDDQAIAGRSSCLPLVYRDRPRTARTRAESVHTDIDRIPAQKDSLLDRAIATRMVRRFWHPIREDRHQTGTKFEVPLPGQEALIVREVASPARLRLRPALLGGLRDRVGSRRPRRGFGCRRRPHPADLDRDRSAARDRCPLVPPDGAGLRGERRCVRRGEGQPRPAGMSFSVAPEASGPAVLYLRKVGR